MTAEELSDLELSGESSDEEDIYNSLPRGFMFEPEDTQEEIERTRAERTTTSYLSILKRKCSLSALIRSISSCVYSGSNI